MKWMVAVLILLIGLVVGCLAGFMVIRHQIYSMPIKYAPEASMVDRAHLYDGGEINVLSACLSGGLECEGLTY